MTGFRVFSDLGGSKFYESFMVLRFRGRGVFGFRGQAEEAGGGAGGGHPLHCGEEVRMRNSESVLFEGGRSSFRKT